MALFTEWRRQVASGHLTWQGLMAAPGRVQPWAHEFPDDAQTELMRLKVADAVAARMDCDASCLPGADPAPDTPEGLDDSGR